MINEEQSKEERPCACATTDCTEMVRSDDYTYPLCVKCEYHGCPIKRRSDDSNAVVSFSDDGGAYVQAWVWVYDDDVEPPKENRRAES